MKRKVKAPALKQKAKELAKPLYARPKAMETIKQMNALRAEHVVMQEAAYRRNEHERLTAQIHSSLSPGIRQDLMAQRNKL